MRFVKSVMLFTALVLITAQPALAENGSEGLSLTAIGAAVAIGLAALGGTLAQGRVASSLLDAIGRNPGAAGKMMTPMIVGLVFIESLVIFSWVIANSILG